MIDWIMQNRDWVFSGIGVTILVGLAVNGDAVSFLVYGEEF
jgi:hypothetical protein